MGTCPTVCPLLPGRSQEDLTKAQVRGPAGHARKLLTYCSLAVSCPKCRQPSDHMHCCPMAQQTWPVHPKSPCSRDNRSLLILMWQRLLGQTPTLFMSNSSSPCCGHKAQEQRSIGDQHPDAKWEKQVGSIVTMSPYDCVVMNFTRMPHICHEVYISEILLTICWVMDHWGYISPTPLSVLTICSYLYDLAFLLVSYG